MSDSALCLKIDGFAGGNVEAIVRELAVAADRLGVWVECGVNGITVLCPPGTTPDLIWNNYQIARDRGASFVSSHVIPSGKQAVADEGTAS